MYHISSSSKLEGSILLAESKKTYIKETRKGAAIEVSPLSDFLHRYQLNKLNPNNVSTFSSTPLQEKYVIN